MIELENILLSMFVYSTIIYGEVYVSCRLPTLIRGAFYDSFPGFLGSGFRKKLPHTKTQQGTDKAIKHNGYTVFLWDLVLRNHQQKWRTICFIIYPLFILLPHNLRQLPFFPQRLPPPRPVHAAAILGRVSISLVVVFLFLHPSAPTVAPV